MERFIHATLMFALTTFIMAASLALIAAAWFITNHFLHNDYRVSVPGWGL